MKTSLYLILSLIILLYISPFFSLYKIVTSIQEQDTQTLNNYMDWPSLKESLKKDVKSFLKDREKLRENSLDNPIEGIFEDVKKFGGLLFGQKAISIAIDKVVSPEGVFKLYKLSNKPKKTRKNTKREVNKTDIVQSDNIFQYDGYALTNFNFITLSDLEATILTSDTDVYFKMKFIFPRWILYTVKSETLTNEIAKKVEDKIDLLKNLNRKINPLKK
ncbi:MAG: DUF2939 domain-containing protein [Thermodesulfobacteriota bacteirum]|nr:DUF2939 domain-containing protein [Thermodesulfobacteriota bacterium]